MTLRCLFVDFNSFFASVEQQDEPRLRHRPVGVVPVLSPTTCCIAASAEAKDHGVTTGTPVWEAVEKCPEIMLVEARPSRYVDMHHRLLGLIEDCIPYQRPALSIDEVACPLIGRERQRDNAVAIADRIHRRIADEFDWIKCSIGIAPNRFLAKTASDMAKRNGLTVLEQADLPHCLHGLDLRAFCGIGASMERRLHDAGIHTAEHLCAATREHLRAAWGSIEGERYWMQLQGHEMPGRATQRSSIGQSHVLGPEFRNFDGARAVLFKLLAKAAMRMRSKRNGGPFLAKGMAIRIRFVGMEHRFERDLRFAPIDDTPALLHLLGEQLSSLALARQRGHWNPKRNPPLSVAITLFDIDPRGHVSEELMPSRRRDQLVSQALDRINSKYGNNTLYFGAMTKAVEHDAAPMRIPFQTIPDREGEEDVSTKKRLPGSAEELYLLRERQFKVLAEASHREAQRRGDTPRGRNAPRSGAGGWLSGRGSHAENEDIQHALF